MCRKPRLYLAGQRFGRLVAIRDNGTQCGHRVWLCECDCGLEHNATVGNLRQGHVKSCGCLKRDIIENSYLLRKTKAEIGVNNESRQ